MYTYRIMKEINTDLFEPAGTWLELRHTSSTLTSDSERDRVNGLAKHKGMTQSEITFEDVGGDINIILDKTGFEYLVAILACGPIENGVYCLGGDLISTLAIEQYDEELDKVIMYRNVGLKSLSLDIQSGDMVRLTAGFIGGYSEMIDTRPSEEGTIIRSEGEPTTSVEMDVDLFLKLDEIPLPITSANILLDNGMQTIRPLGKDYNLPFGVDHLIPEGQISIYSDLESFNVFKAKMDNDPFRLVFSSDYFEMILYRTYLGGDLPKDDGRDTDVIINLDFEAVYDEASEEIATVRFF